MSYGYPDVHRETQKRQWEKRERERERGGSDTRYQEKGKVRGVERRELPSVRRPGGRVLPVNTNQPAGGAKYTELMLLWAF